LFFGLTTLRDFAAAYFLLIRHPDQIHERKWLGFNDVLAYGSSALPLTYFSSVSDPSAGLWIATQFLVIIGFALATLALLELGSSFGISPARRRSIASGVYRYMSHPMYAGYIISEVGFVLLNPANVFLFVLSVCLYWRRAGAEKRVLLILS